MIFVGFTASQQKQELESNIFAGTGTGAGAKLFGGVSRSQKIETLITSDVTLRFSDLQSPILLNMSVTKLYLIFVRRIGTQKS